MNNKEYKEKLKDLFFALKECEKSWEMAVETGNKEDYFENQNKNIANDCAACEHHKQFHNDEVFGCHGNCIIKWGDKIPKAEFNYGFIDPIYSFACERFKDSPFNKWYDLDTHSELIKNAKKILKCIRKSKRYYEILFKKFEL